MIHIETGSSIPIYRQIQDQIRKSIATTSLETGDALPSTRRLAEQLGVNPNTVARAVRELVQDGTLISHHGKNLVVAEKRRVLSQEERERRLNEALNILMNEVLLLDFKSEEVRTALDRKWLEIHPLPGS